MKSAIYFCFLAVLICKVESANCIDTIFADNWFKLWVNGKLAVTDPVTFTPHQAVTFSFEDGE